MGRTIGSLLEGVLISTDIYTDLLTHWDIGLVQSITAQEPGAFAAGNVTFIETESGARYVLKRKTVPRTMQHEYALLAALAAQGVPVAVPVRTRSGEPYVQAGETCFVLSPHLPGTVYSDHYAPGARHRARQFGAAIARLHASLRHCDLLVRAVDMDLPGEIARNSPVVRSIVPASQPSIDMILAELQAGLVAHYADLPVQLIHRDAHPGNMLFMAGQLSGWLDFEIMLRGPRLFDLCYCSTSLLISGMDDTVKRQTWFSLLAALVEGYETVSPLTAAERLALWYVLLAIEVIFIAFFSELNHPVGVAQNIDALTWIYRNRNEYQHHQPV